MTPNKMDTFDRFKNDSNLNFRKTPRRLVRGSHDGVQITVSQGVTPCHPSSKACRPQLHSSTHDFSRGELSYLAPLGSENISAPYFKQCFFRWGGDYPQTVKHHASQSQDRNNKYFILNIEFCINNKISNVTFL